MTNADPHLTWSPSAGAYVLSEPDSPAIGAAKAGDWPVYDIEGLDDDPHVLYDVTGRTRPTVGKKDLGCAQSGTNFARTHSQAGEVYYPRSLYSNGAAYVDHTKGYTAVPQKVIRGGQRHPSHQTPDGLVIYGKQFGMNGVPQPLTSTRAKNWLPSSEEEVTEGAGAESAQQVVAGVPSPTLSPAAHGKGTRAPKPTAPNATKGSPGAPKPPKDESSSSSTSPPPPPKRDETAGSGAGAGAATRGDKMPNPIVDPIVVTTAQPTNSPSAPATATPTAEATKKPVWRPSAAPVEEFGDVGAPTRRPAEQPSQSSRPQEDVFSVNEPTLKPAEQPNQSSRPQEFVFGDNGPTIKPVEQPSQSLRPQESVFNVNEPTLKPAEQPHKSSIKPVEFGDVGAPTSRPAEWKPSGKPVEFGDVGAPTSRPAEWKPSSSPIEFGDAGAPTTRPIEGRPTTKPQEHIFAEGPTMAPNEADLRPTVKPNDLSTDSTGPGEERGISKKQQAAAENASKRAEESLEEGKKTGKSASKGKGEKEEGKSASNGKKSDSKEKDEKDEKDGPRGSSKSKSDSKSDSKTKSKSDSKSEGDGVLSEEPTATVPTSQPALFPFSWPTDRTDAPVAEATQQPSAAATVSAPTDKPVEVVVPPADVNVDVRGADGKEMKPREIHVAEFPPPRPDAVKFAFAQDVKPADAP